MPRSRPACGTCSSFNNGVSPKGVRDGLLEKREAPPPTRKAPRKLRPLKRRPHEERKIRAMSDHHDNDDTPISSAKLLLPVVITGMLLLMLIMYYGGMSSGFYSN